MHATIQDFPRLTIEQLQSGIIRFEDDSHMDGPQSVDVHPAQLQIAARMMGFDVPDATAAALARLSRRLQGIHKQVESLESQLRYAMDKQDIGVAPELTAAEFIGQSLGELLQDLEDLQAPGLEHDPEVVNPGGQLALPV